MSSRRGVSLVEVLVATVLLAIGVAGCVAALQAASRLRLDAATRESATATVERRLTWFESRACLGGDTVIVVLAPDTERWVLARDRLQRIPRMHRGPGDHAPGPRSN